MPIWTWIVLLLISAPYGRVTMNVEIVFFINCKTCNYCPFEVVRWMSMPLPLSFSWISHFLCTQIKCIKGNKCLVCYEVRFLAVIFVFFFVCLLGRSCLLITLTILVGRARWYAGAQNRFPPGISRILQKTAVKKERCKIMEKRRVSVAWFHSFSVDVKRKWE